MRRRGATTTCTARAVFGASGEISIRRGRRQPRERPTRREGLDDAGLRGRVGWRAGPAREKQGGGAFSRFWSGGDDNINIRAPSNSGGDEHDFSALRVARVGRVYVYVTRGSGDGSRSNL